MLRKFRGKIKILSTHNLFCRKFALSSMLYYFLRATACNASRVLAIVEVFVRLNGKRRYQQPSFLR